MQTSGIAGVRTTQLAPGKDQAIGFRRIVVRRNVEDGEARLAAALNSAESDRRTRSTRNRRTADGQGFQAIGLGTADARLHVAAATGAPGRRAATANGSSAGGATRPARLRRLPTGCRRPA